MVDRVSPLSVTERVWNISHRWGIFPIFYMRNLPPRVLPKRTLPSTAKLETTKKAGKSDPLPLTSTIYWDYTEDDIWQGLSSIGCQIRRAIDKL